MKPLKRNIKAAIALARRYNTISIEEIRDLWKTYPPTMLNSRSYLVAGKLTGFGNFNTCNLCRTVKGGCGKCIYGGFTFCIDGSKRVKLTYNAIENAKGPTSLLRAFKNRAKFIKSVLRKLTNK